MLKFRFLQASFLFLLFMGCASDETMPEPEEEQPIGEFLDDWTFSVFPDPTYSNFEIGQFRLWVPEDPVDLKAVLVLLTSSNGNALGLANSTEWQTYAENERLALCSINFKSLSSGNYAQAGSGSGQALMDAIELIAMANGIPKISDLPFLLRGYSAGGNFSYSFSSFKPEKVVGLVSIRAGQLEMTSTNASVPGLILTGEREGEQRNEFLREIALDKRKVGGLWSFAIEPNATHFTNLKASDDLA
ncbi:MAG: hypothetical protein HKN31_01710, partial [Pricia sp.]|nr:hypothetical protein [Pricia sp.]